MKKVVVYEEESFYIDKHIEIGNCKIEIDDVNKLWRIKYKYDPWKTYQYAHVSRVEVANNETILTQTSTGSSLGRAAVGGVLFGAAGAIIGGATAKQTSTSQDDFSIRILVNNLSESAISIPCYSNIKVAEEILGTFQYIIDNTTEDAKKRLKDEEQIPYITEQDAMDSLYAKRKRNRMFGIIFGVFGILILAILIGGAISANNIRLDESRIVKPLEGINFLYKDALEAEKAFNSVGIKSLTDIGRHETNSVHFNGEILDMFVGKTDEEQVEVVFGVNRDYKKNENAIRLIKLNDKVIFPENAEEPYELSATTEASVAPTVEVKIGTVVNVEDTVNIRSDADRESEIVGTAKNGDVYSISEAYYTKGWHRIDFNGKAAFISSDYLDVGDIPMPAEIPIGVLPRNPIEISASELAREISADFETADEKYNNKFFLITGKIVDISAYDDMVGYYMVNTLKSGKNRVVCWFDGGNVEYDMGQTITVLGRTSNIGNSTELTRCEIK